ncbi:phosphatase PAP2 family protein [Leuconostoc citreum]
MIIKQKTQIIFALITFSIFLCLTIGLVSQALWFEQLNIIGQHLIQQRSPLADIILINITQLGSVTFIGLSTLILIIFLSYKKAYPALQFLLVNIFLYAGLTTQITKRIIRNPRPMPQLIPEHGFSFPSGHTMVAILFYGTLIVLTKRYVSKSWLQLTSITIFTLLLFVIPISRIYVNVHYPTDIIAALSLGYSLLTLSKYLFLTGDSYDTIN